MRTYIGSNHPNNADVTRVIYAIPNRYKPVRNWVREQFNC